MAEGGGGEKASFGKIARSHGHYGTAKQSISRTESYIHHKVEKDDTLQGIALKHGVTMEHIKRANKIWTNDSLYLRDDLLIPIVPTAEHATFQGQNGDSSVLDDVEFSHNFVAPSSVPSTKHLVTHGSPRNSPNRGNHNNSKGAENSTKTQSDISSSNKNISSRTDGKVAPPEPEISAQDFLSKFDVNLAKIKKDVKAMEQKTEFSIDDERNPLNHLPPTNRKTSRYVQRPRGHSLDSQHNSDAASSSSSPELVIKSKVRSQQINKSVARFEPAHEQLFQL